MTKLLNFIYMQTFFFNFSPSLKVGSSVLCAGERRVGVMGKAYRYILRVRVALFCIFAYKNFMDGPNTSLYTNYFHLILQKQ